MLNLYYYDSEENQLWCFDANFCTPFQKVDDFFEEGEYPVTEAPVVARLGGLYNWVYCCLIAGSDIPEWVYAKYPKRWIDKAISDYQISRA